MSFKPLNEGFSTSLLGSSYPAGYEHSIRYNPDKNLSDRDIHSNIDSQTSILKTIIVIFISAIIFITVISIYDVLRNYIIYYYNEQTLYDSQSEYTNVYIRQQFVSNKNIMLSSIVFSLICIFSSIILILILVYIYL